MKMAPILAALDGAGADTELVHTGQHYDHSMSGSFFDDLGLPLPDIHLAVGSGSHAEQTAGVLIAYERHLMDTKPDVVVVAGDVNATLGAALAATKLHIPVAHVEAGLRSGDWSMPEEVNRVLTDRMSQWLLTPSADADDNLRAEGIPSDRIHLVGNVMIDTLLRLLPEARNRFDVLAAKLALPTKYSVVTLHRPTNVDGEDALRRLVRLSESIADLVPVVFPVHPRTQRQLEKAGLTLGGRVNTTEPLGYLDFLALIDGSSLVVTDSGGIQEETSVLGVPCLTVRNSTERPITVTHGTNRVVGTDPDTVVGAAAEALERPRHAADIPLWDGKAAKRIAAVLLSE